MARAHHVTLQACACARWLVRIIAASGMIGAQPAAAQDCNSNSIPDAMEVAPIILQPDAAQGKDTFISGGGGPKEQYNYGVTPFLYVGKSGLVASHRSLIEFDLSGIAAGAEVRRAILKMYVPTTAQLPELRIYRMTVPWLEGSGNGPPASGDGATWKTSDGVTSWCGGAFKCAAEPEELGASNTIAVGWNEIALDPSRVNEWLSGAFENNGMLLKHPTEPMNQTIEFASSDHPDAGIRPILELTIGHDCNSNGIPDDCDIAAMTSQDSNANGVPDECEPSVDQVTLESTCGTNTEEEDLIGEVVGAVNTITTITDWRVNGASVALVNMPFDTNTGATTKDYSTGGYDGAVQGPVWSAAGQVGGAYDFDGIDDLIDLGTTTALYLNTQISLQAWVRPDSFGSKRAIILKDRDYALYVEPGGNLNFYLWDGFLDLNSNGTIPAGQWSHVAGTYSGSEARIYINGATDVSVPLSGTFGQPDTKGECGVGAHVHDQTLFFDGAIDEVKIFNYAVNAEQITEDYQAGLAGMHKLTMVSEETAAGEVWQVCGTPSDQVQDGATVCSNELIVLSSPPNGDCNGNGVPDACDIGDQTSNDCNNNGIPDECEIDKNSTAPGGPFFCTAGCDPDCNNNGIPDACDLADCPPATPACDDCNLNGVLDECDIAAGASMDADSNGVPDECVDFLNACSGDPAWSCPDNWNLAGGYPDSDPENPSGVADLSVTLPAEQNAFLDVTVEIDTLRVLAGATLEINQNSAGEGDLIIDEPGGMLLQGTLMLAADRLIDASAGAVVIGIGGSYQADVERGGGTSGLTAASMTILEGPPGQAGQMLLTDSMSVLSYGNVVLNDEGSCSPPILNVSDAAGMIVEGDFQIIAAANLQYASSVPMTLNGDFLNGSLFPEMFDWAEGALLMNAGPNLQNITQTIEAAGEDRGPWPIGLVDNFEFGTLELAADTTASIVDTIDNQQDGTTACDEALYIGTLILQPGAMLTSADCAVYYGDLQNHGGTITGSEIEHIHAVGDINDDGCVNAFDLAVLLGAWGDPGCPGDDHCIPDMNSDGKVNATDLAMLLGNWGCR